MVVSIFYSCGKTRSSEFTVVSTETGINLPGKGKMFLTKLKNKKGTETQFYMNDSVGEGTKMLLEFNDGSVGLFKIIK